MDNNQTTEKKDDKKYPLKVNSYTTVLVPAERNTPEYAAILRAKFNSSFSSRASLKDL